MGKQVRFARQQSIVSYKSTVPVAYIKQEDQKQKPHGGTIGTEKRWSKTNNQQTPGVGQYNITGYKSLGKAAESSFDLGDFKLSFKMAQKNTDKI